MTSLISLFCLQLLLIHKSWVVFIYAITISVESIFIEFLTTTFLEITPIMLSAISITLAGIMLLLVAWFLMKRKEIATLLLKSWKNLSLASFFLAAGIFTWYDSINRIGASKEVLIAGPLEIVIIVVSLHSSIEVAGASMLISGLILVSFMVGFSYESLQVSLVAKHSLFKQPQMNTIIILALFSLLPFIGSLSYSTGLSRIGASITATIGSSSILITIIIQITLRELGVKSNLPENIFIAIVGGVIGFLGIYIIHMHDRSMSVNLRKNK